MEKRIMKIERSNEQLPESLTWQRSNKKNILKEEYIIRISFISMPHHQFYNTILTRSVFFYNKHSQKCNIFLRNHISFENLKISMK